MGGAEVIIPSRFVNPDTTLLRDTLDISFDRIFVLADSLRCTPDTLRALAIRYAFSLERLVFLADSMHVRDMDVLGQRIEETRGLILATAGQQGVTFVYGSGYNTAQTQTNWSNTLDYTWVDGTRVVKNRTNVSLTRQTGGSKETKLQTRRSETSVGWLLSPRVSVGGRVNLYGSAHLDRTIYSFNDDNSDVQMSMETKHDPLPGLHVEFNLYEGITNQDKGTTSRSGYLGEVNGRMRYERGAWLSWEMNGVLNGNHLKTRTLNTPFRTTDLANRANGSLALFQAAPVSARIDFTYDAPHFEQVPPPSGTDSRLFVTSSSSKTRTVKGSMRFQGNNDTYVDVSGDLGDRQTPVNTGAGNVTYADDVSFGNDRNATISGNTRILGWALNSTFILNRNELFTPRVRADSPRFHERAVSSSRSLETNVSRALTRRLTARMAGSISLDSFDYSVNTTFAEATPDRDSPRQSWRVEGTYQASESYRNTVSLEVSRWQDLNISGTASASNTENRNYRAGWQWTARLTRGLTVNQTNSINAGYLRQLFSPSQNRLSIHYTTVTTLNALITPRLAMDVTHNADFEPSGAYRVNRDGVEAFSPSGDSRNYVLNASIRYTASPALTLTLNPVYYYRGNAVRTNGVSIPQRSVKTLSLSGGANVNLTIGNQGRLTGQITRQFNDQGTLEYAGPTAGVVHRTEYDYWNGSLQFSWKL